jgi:hypothetical protein
VWGCVGVSGRGRQLSRERVLGCGGAPKRGDGAAFDPLAKLGDALRDAAEVETSGADAADLVAVQAASKDASVASAGSDTRAGRYGAAHLSEVMALPLSPSNNLVIPSVV